MLLLHKSMVRHLEYAVQAWCPNKISDIKLLGTFILEHVGEIMADTIY